MNAKELKRLLKREGGLNVREEADGSVTVRTRPLATLDAVVIKKDGTRIDLGEIWNNEKENG